MQTVNREQFIKELESVQAGLSVRAATEQSNCFVFSDGVVRTFNDEIACEQKTSLKITGAVIADPLISLLRKLPEEEVEIGRKNGKLRVQGKKRGSGITFQQDVALPFDEIGEPGKWKKLDKDFLEAMSMVAECASDDQTAFVYTCVRITPKYMEAMDLWQVGRFDIESPVQKPVFIRKLAAQHLTELDVTHVAESEAWLHFKNKAGFRIACRASREEQYPNIAEFLDVKGSKARLPKGLADATDRAGVFLDAAKDDRFVEVRITNGSIKIKGRGSFGWYWERRKLNYKGPDTAFNISAKLLAHITTTYNDCVIGEDRLKVDAGRFHYATSLKDKE
jgi:hypothetical protein